MIFYVKELSPLRLYIVQTTSTAILEDGQLYWNLVRTCTFPAAIKHFFVCFLLGKLIVHALRTTLYI